MAQVIHYGDKWWLVDNDQMTPLDKEKNYQVEESKDDTRTIMQNRALHKYYSMVAAALTDAGLDIKEVIKADVSWTMVSVKEIMWKKLQQVLLGKASTTKLKKHEIDVVYGHMNKLLGERFGIYIPFPSRDKD